MKQFYRHMLLVGAMLATGLVSACLPDSKDPDKTTSDAGQINGEYFAASLGNIALKVQNAVVGNASWFTTQTASMQLNLASMGIDANMLGVPVKSSICPTGSGSEVLQMTWLEGRDATGKFTIKGMGSDAGQMIGELRTRVATNQVGQFTGGTSLALEDGSTMTIPASCANMGLPTGVPVLVFRIARPAAPVSEMSRKEYRTTSCGSDMRGRAMRGTMVQSRVVKYLADGSITPSSPTVGWIADNIGQCVADTDIVGTKSATNTTGASAALGNFADIAAKGMKDMLETQLKMGCTNGVVTKDAVLDGRRDQSSKTIDTCKSVNITAAGSIIDETDLSHNADVRNVCPRYADVTRALLGVSTGRYISNYGSSAPTNVANLERVVDKVDLNTDSVNQGQREVWEGKRINCAGTDDYIVNCANVPKRPTGAEDTSVEKWISRNLNDLGNANGSVAVGLILVSGVIAVAAYMAASVVFAIFAPIVFIFAFLFGGSWVMTGGNATMLNSEYFKTIHTYHGPNSTTTAHRDLHATSWTDPYTYFIPNFNVPASTLGWRVPGGTNACYIMKRELQLVCPTHYNASKEGNWNPYELTLGAEYITLIPGVGRGGERQETFDTYKKLINNGLAIANLSANYEKSCPSFFNWGKKCHKTEQIGPGKDVYIISWNYTDQSSVSGGSTDVQNIMMNKDGQKIDYKPEIVPSPPKLEYVGHYGVPLHCGRIESKTMNWPTTEYYQDCGGKGGCKTKARSTTTTITERVVREWVGDNATNGTWSRPVYQYVSSVGIWNNINQIPNPLTVWQ